ncbi:MAG: nucleotide exchange factor GrpE [Candidatus Omnitrophica bacterium]|nr:nucleotide exchange factor GrpE [Candidatus Omnitrophota bacterium]
METKIKTGKSDKKDIDVKEDDILSCEDSLEKEVQEGGQKESQVSFDKLLRLQAEFENYRKRLEKEKSEFIKFANEGIIKELLKVVDNFERAVHSTSATQDFKVLHQGVEMILKQLQDVLNERGLNKIESVGTLFDPLKHEAIAEVITEEHPEHLVVEELQKGYMLNGRVIRPAAVRVAKRPEKKEIT